MADDPADGEGTDPLKEIPTSVFADDDGSADATLAQALIRVHRGRAPMADLVDALAYARVLVPMVADGEERGMGKHGLEQDHVASTGVVAVQMPDGRAALPIFTDVDAMRAWREDARPIPAEGPRAALAAVTEGWQVLVLNPAQEATVIPRPAVWALAQGQPWSPAVVDDTVAADVREAVADALQAIAEVVSADAVPGESAELRVAVALQAGLTSEGLRAVLAQVQSALAASEVVAERVDSVELSVSQAGSD